VRRGATEGLVAKLADYEDSDLPERTKAALRLADKLSGDDRSVDADFMALIAHLPHHAGATTPDVRSRQQRAVEKRLDAVMRKHRRAPDLLHEARAQRAADGAAGVVGAQAEEEGGARLVPLQDLQQARDALARSAECIDVDLEGELGQGGASLCEKEDSRERDCRQVALRV